MVMSIAGWKAESCCFGPQLFTQHMIFITTVLITVAIMIPGSIAIVEEPLLSKTNQDLAEEFGLLLSGKMSQFTGYFAMEEMYNQRHAAKEFSIHKLNGSRLAENFANELEEMLKKRKKAVQKLVEVAEAEAKNFNWSSIPEPNYNNIMYINQKDENEEQCISQQFDEYYENFYRPMEFEYSLKFGRRVNKTESIVQVPFPVYSKGTELTRSVEWSKVLNDQFKKNYANNPSLKWQYFGSTTGFVRIYPGFQWALFNCDGTPNIYDCRTRQWYTQSATYTKDMLILLDTSGSMSGFKMHIARDAIFAMMNMLGDNDFFNVLTFGEKTKPVNKCFNNTMIQTNWINKQIVLESLAKIKPWGVADFDVALETALTLMKDFHRRDEGSNCGSILMIVSDGAPENFEYIFEKHRSSDFQIRVFSYLVGYEKGYLAPLRQMACNNHGYFTQLRSRNGVDEQVLLHTTVLNRPLAFDHDHHVIWTKAYYSAKTDDMESSLVSTVAIPVYRNINGTSNLLGIMATDVPVDDILDSIPVNKIGVNGYIYLITNNGHTLIHPRFKPKYKNEFGLEAVKPNYDNVDIDSLENSTASEQVRAGMLNRETGSVQADRIVTPLADMTRVLMASGTYYYVPIRDTPFLLSVVLPSGYGHRKVNYSNDLKTRYDASYDENSCNEALKLLMKNYAISISRTAAICSVLYSRIEIAEPWSYCRFNNQDTVVEMSQLDMFKAFVTDKHNNTISCNEEMVKGVLFDAYLMATMKAIWSEYRRFRNTSRAGVILSFMISKSGVLIDYWHEEQHASYMKTRKAVFKFSRVNFPEVYRRTVVQPPDDWLYSLPSNDTSSAKRPGGVIAATKAIRLNNAVLGVAGLLFKYNKFNENYRDLENLSENCGKNGKNLYDCYLIDENAIILYADSDSQVGKYLGLVNGGVVKRCIEKGIFIVVNLVDSNAVCKKELPSKKSSACFRASPFYAIWNNGMRLIKYICQLLINLATFNWMGIFFTCSPTESASTKAPKYRTCERKYEVALVNRSKVPYVGVELCQDGCTPG
ncbi:unnamed protein product [Clavelina lepadiformis]|uniref:VWFA domain-containing protein n=1 Tax=Clavelina lepadiformis TaxID=159417 RepID=A0ABP0GHR5_CLALP